jgi:hypothetical protein
MASLEEENLVVFYYLWAFGLGEEVRCNRSGLSCGGEFSSILL